RAWSRQREGASESPEAPATTDGHAADAPPKDAGSPEDAAAEASGGDGDVATEEQLTPEERRTVASWDRDVEALERELRQARATVREVPLPASLTATQVLHLAADPDG